MRVTAFERRLPVPDTVIQFSQAMTASAPGNLEPIAELLRNG